MAATGPDDRDAAFAGALLALARRLLPATRSIAGVRRMTGGATQEIWAFDAIGAIDGEAGEKLILRRMPANGRTSDGAVTIEQEAEIVRVCGEQGLPVPRLFGTLVPADGLGRGYVMARIAGEAIPRRLFRDEAFAAVRPQLAHQFGAVLAGLHALDTAPFAGLAVRTAAEALAEQAARIDRYAIANPVFAQALRWLEAHRPPAPDRLALVHGDFRTGNLMIAPGGLAAVLDWELAHLGDPMEDLGWLCMNSWRFGHIDRPAGGFGSRAQLHDGYRAAGGGAVDPAAVRFWEAIGTLRWGISCTTMADVFQRGDRSPERALIARRASECAVDILALIAPRR